MLVHRLSCEDLQDRDVRVTETLAGCTRLSRPLGSRLSPLRASEPVDGGSDGIHHPHRSRPKTISGQRECMAEKKLHLASDYPAFRALQGSRGCRRPSNGIK